MSAPAVPPAVASTSALVRMVTAGALRELPEGAEALRERPRGAFELPEAVCFAVEESDLPEGLTLPEWSRARAHERREARQVRRLTMTCRVARILSRYRVTCAALVFGFHVGHMALGLPALEGLEGVLLQVGQLDQPQHDHKEGPSHA